MILRYNAIRQDDGHYYSPTELLQRFRKEAIYRRMKHYSRAYERSEARVAELERQKNTCEAGLAALEACWTQVCDCCHSYRHFGLIRS